MGNADDWFDDLDEENRIGQALDLDDEFETVGFTLTHEVFLAGEWLPVVRFIYEDSKIWVEKFPKGGRSPLQPRAEMAEINDVWIAWDVARSRMTNRQAWEARLKEYLNS